MKTSYALLATFACLVLGFCIAAAITAQASHTWWEIENNTTTTTKRFYFGLYQVCVEETSGASVSEKCYTFRLNGVKDFVNEQIGGSSTLIVNTESRGGQDVWILAFFAIVFTGMAFILSLPTALLSYTSNIHDAIPKLQCVFTFFGTVLGVTSVACAYDLRDTMWPTGVDALKAKYLVTGNVEFTGRGFLFQTLYVAIEAVAFFAYLIMMKIQPSSKEMSV